MTTAGAGHPRPPLLVTSAIWPALMADLRKRYEVAELAAGADLAASPTIADAGRYAVLVSSSRNGLGAGLMQALPRLRMVSNFGVGLEKLDLAGASTRGIRVGYTAGVLTECVADLAFGLMLDAARQLAFADRFVRAGRWSAGEPFPLGHRVHGKRLGIAGFGRIGRAVARRAAGFGMPVRYFSSAPAADLPDAFVADLAALADWADFLVLALPGGPSTQGIVGRQVLQALGRNGFLVNVARGSLVDEQALADCLQRGELAGAALDVHAREPAVSEALTRLDRAVLLPHLGSSTEETRRAMADLVLANLDAHFTGRPLPCEAC